MGLNIKKFKLYFDQKLKNLAADLSHSFNPKKLLVSHRLTSQLYQRDRLKKILASGKPLKIHLGCGDDYFPGYVNIDAYPESKADLIMDSKNLTLFPDNCAEIIESYHFFEHLQLHEARESLKEWFRILQPGGTVVIELPNLAVCAQEIGKHFNPKDGVDLAMAGIFSYPALVAEQGYGMIHKWGWTPETLGAELSAVGFVEVQQHPIKQTWRLGTSWNRDMQMRGVKPQ
ncbi:MAG: methyltransferase domain-containing protein [Hydrococcus sp. C42_A2020_068]|uniref:class I SAM-dependent methyltransferase n=1 Tax=Pleurocapsa sp. PCC 7327 TaxID=118163 RepID=UPI00029F86F6|nr:methyltransferase domain-containing protein [Pleurocapsa sp. PCC 7327]AFY77445.1 methyltransferase family protein [Pleurocapsa sp. PCC 7327]MBF2019657.1 methyltransferase domain-containing protein [Hydrococcus sp. C42_A2020_068]